jgi:hypothetical protein
VRETIASIAFAATPFRCFSIQKTLNSINGGLKPGDDSFLSRTIRVLIARWTPLPPLRYDAFAMATARQPSNIATPTGLDDFLHESTVRGEVVGSWGFNPVVDFTRMNAEQSNVWFFEQVFNFLRSFFGLVVPDNMEITLYNASRQITKENLNQMTFLDELMLAMKGLEQSMWCLRLNLNIVGFLRTDWAPDKAVRLQIQEPATFLVWGGPDETGFQTFSLGYRLFAEQKLEGEHSLLWSMNQPLLEKALRKWERQSRHAIDVVTSNSDELPLYRHGFSRPAPAGIRPKPRPRDEGPVDDFLPDLDELKF